jgi:hypothetical protein
LYFKFALAFFWALGRKDEFTSALRSWPRNPDKLQDIAEVQAFRGEFDEALQSLSDAIKAGPEFFEGLKYDRYFDRVRSDPRFVTLLRKTSE